MSVRGNPNGCSKKAGPSSVKDPKPRHSKPGYQDRVEERRQQKHNTKPAKSRIVLKGTSRPTGAIPGVGKDRDNAWRDYVVQVPNESIMRGRGYKRSFERTQPNMKRR